MNRRRAARKRVNRLVTLEEPHTGSCVASMRNLSVGGAFIVTDSARLSHHAHVVATFELESDRRRHEFRLEAVVVHTTSTGAGLMFLNTPAHEIRRLSEALFRLSLADTERVSKRSGSHDTHAEGGE